MTTLDQTVSTPVRRGLAPLRSAWTLSAILLVALAIFDPARLGDIATGALSSLAQTAPYIAAAVLFIAWIRAASAESVIAGVFEGRETRMIVVAALVGGLAPFCSCQVIPFIAAMLGVGAPLSAVMAFWLSSPLVDPPTLLITAGALGWDFAIAKAISAIGLGLLGGFGLRAMLGWGWFANPLRVAPKTSCCSAPAAPEAPVWRFWTEPDRRRFFAQEALTNALFLLKWLTLAYILEGMLIAYVPADLVARAVGGEGLGSVAIGALVGMPAYLNGYVAPPLLAGLIEQGMGRGAALAFMIAGAVSCIPAMAAVWALVRPPVFAAYAGFGLLGAIIAGAIFAML